MYQAASSRTASLAVAGAAFAALTASGRKAVELEILRSRAKLMYRQRFTEGDQGQFSVFCDLHLRDLHSRGFFHRIHVDRVL